MHDQFHILAAVLAQWRRPVASIVSLDPLSWVISLALYWRTATVSETADKYGAFCRFFLDATLTLSSAGVIRSEYSPDDGVQWL